MSEFAEDERAYMDYLDEVYCDDYGRLQKQGDPIAFSVGLNDWLREKEDRTKMVWDLWPDSERIRIAMHNTAEGYRKHYAQSKDTQER